jgi:hypothetical protein
MSATGPFTVVKERNAAPLLCQSALGGDIDPSAFRQDAVGNTYLVTKVDGNSMARPTRIENRRLEPTLWTFAPFNPTVLLNSTTGTWERQVIEGPDLTFTGGRLHLLYSGGDFASTGYGEGQALCSATSRLCGRNGRLLDSPVYGAGAGGASAFTSAAGTPLLAWHSYPDGKTSGPRVLSFGAVTSAAGGVLSVGTTPVGGASASASDVPSQRVGAPTRVQLTVPSGLPVTVPNAHSR